MSAPRVVAAAVLGLLGQDIYGLVWFALFAAVIGANGCWLLTRPFAGKAARGPK